MIRLLSFLVSCLGALLSGLTFYLGWCWFLVPIGAPIIVYWQAVGLIYLVAFLTQRVTLTEYAYLRAMHDDEDEKSANALTTGIMDILKPLYYLFFLWLIHFVV